MRFPLRMVTTLLGALFVVVFGMAGVIATQVATAAAKPHAVQVPPPSGDNGTTIDPLQYNCGNDAPTCGQVGESNGYYNRTNVDLLYSENYYCDANVSSAAATGCEAGAGPSPTPSPVSAGDSGTSLGNTTHNGTLYIPVPLFANPPPTQCTATATCIDHPPTIDLSRIASALPGDPSPPSVSNVPIPAHDHIVGTRNGGLPEWWNVRSSPRAIRPRSTPDQCRGHQRRRQRRTAVRSPTNAFLFFQVLPGTAFSGHGSGSERDGSPGSRLAPAPAPPPASQVEPGTTFNNLKNDCGATAPNCQNIGVSRDWIDGQDVEALYTEPYYCGTTTVSGPFVIGVRSGSDPTSVPPGVADRTPPTPTQTNSQIDRLYIPVPLYSSPAGCVRPVLEQRSPASTIPPPSTSHSWRRSSVNQRHLWTTCRCRGTTTS